MLVLDVAWAATTWNAFTILGESAWFPYPSLAIGWFLHIYGSVTITVSAKVFGWLVMPLVRGFDPEQHELEERKKKLERMNLWSKEGEQEQIMVQQQQYPVHSQGYPGQAEYYGNGSAVNASHTYPAAMVQDYQGANIYGAPMAPMQAPQIASQV